MCSAPKSPTPDSQFLGRNSMTSQVVLAIEQDIRSGRLPAGAPLKSVRAMATDFQVSSMVISEALGHLERKGLIERKPRRGVFVRPATTSRKLLVLFQSKADHTYPWHYIMPGMLESCRDYGFEVEPCDMEDFSELSHEDVIMKLREHNLFGIMVINCFFHGNEPILELLKDCGLPVMLIHGTIWDYETTGWATIVLDTQAGWRTALIHLRSCGTQRILTIAYKNVDDDIRLFSRKHYLALMREIGLDDDENLIVTIAPGDFEGLKKQVRRIFHEPENRPQAVMCFSDFCAPAVYQALREEQLQIPQDVAVMGFCGAPLGTLMKPELSTIDIGYREIGRIALRTMADASHWFTPEQPGWKPPLVWIPHHLLVRESTGQTERPQEKDGQQP